MKIIMFGQKRVPSREGGIEVVVEELSTRMAMLGHAVTVVNRRGHHVSGAEFDGEQLAEYKGVKILNVPTLKRKGVAAVSSSFFAAIRASFGPYDIVHIHAEGPAAFCWLPKLMGKKVICTCHGLDWSRPKWKNTLGGKYIKYGEKMMAKYADAVIVLSKDIGKYFKNTYGRKTVFIPNGVNRPEQKEPQVIKKKYGLNKNSYVLVLARLTSEKRIDMLIDVYRSLNTDKKLVIAGGSSDSDGYIKLLHNMAKNDDRIMFTGFVQGRELEELYSNAYMYVLPSELEGMPLSLLEAMSYGNCCLTSNISECTDVIGNKGVSFTVNDKENLMRELQKLLDSPDKVEMYKNQSSDYVCRKYNWDDVVEKTLNLYQKVK